MFQLDCMPPWWNLKWVDWKCTSERERERERKAVSGVNVTRIHVTRRAGVRGESSRWTHRQSVIQR